MQPSRATEDTKNMQSMAERMMRETTIDDDVPSFIGRHTALQMVSGRMRARHPHRQFRILQLLAFFSSHVVSVDERANAELIVVQSFFDDRCRKLPSSVPSS
jgi:hypothetical protein